MNVYIEHLKEDPEKIKSVHIDGKKSCAFGVFNQAIDVTMDRKEIRILDIDHVTSMWMTKAELSMYISLLQKIHDQMEYDSNFSESSEDKQERLNCILGIGINNWNCYKDCAFWDGKKCTEHET